MLTTTKRMTYSTQIVGNWINHVMLTGRERSLRFQRSQPQDLCVAKLVNGTVQFPFYGKKGIATQGV
ncbi:hypothetical protein M514_02302 [Trichuris suis]|uniref:Uncharacterized protein n=1 Tax=Trichuris suis TaxID=68888 RepID=A0A085MHD0_9BILA|nr:hypothetical protein M513_02302 [Trichuris suis]KFD66800.1 hypothetical protein M514_02302 [Trichuris suis]